MAASQREEDLPKVDKTILKQYVLDELSKSEARLVSGLIARSASWANEYERQQLLLQDSNG